jgi:hypothetical protein
MSSEFGYIPESPEQSFGNNKGIFTPTDIYDLTRADKYTQYGQLELIETKTISSSSSAIFTSIDESKYNVHFLTINNYQPTTDSKRVRIRFFESGVEETASVYQVATQQGLADGTFTEVKSTGQDHLRSVTSTGNSTSPPESGNGYIYFYNLGDSSKYSFVTMQTSAQNAVPRFIMEFGSGVLPQASTVDQIKLYVNAGTFSATASLYGIKEYS